MNDIIKGRGAVANPDEMRDGLKLSDRATLSLLSVLEGDDAVTQRGLASRIGIALGLTNSLLKRAVRKGLIKIQQVPARRYAYFVTPQGFSEKSRLVAQYLSSSLTFFRQAREEFLTIYEQVEAQGHSTIALFGAGELAEIAIMSALEGEVQLRGLIHFGSNRSNFSGLAMISSLDDPVVHEIDAVVITSTEDPQAAYETLRKYFSDERLYTVPLLHVSRNTNGDKAGQL